jgi:hypothetical protein
MEQKLYKRVILIPATSEEEAEQKFQTLLKGKQNQPLISEKWNPILAICASAWMNYINEKKANFERLKKQGL